MKLNDILSGQLNTAEWEAKGYQLPKFDIKAVREKTAKEPTWVHFGGGNIFRAFPAAILNDALNTGKYDRGVIVAETFDFEVIDKAYAPYNNLSLLVSLQSTGTIEKKVIASVTEALKADPQFDDWKRLVEIFKNPSLQMISFTITEKGYGFNDADLARGLQPVFSLMSRCDFPIASSGMQQRVVWSPSPISSANDKSISLSTSSSTLNISSINFKLSIRNRNLRRYGGQS